MKTTIKEQTKRIIEENKQARLKLKQDKIYFVKQQKEQQNDHIYKFILNNYEITNSNKDRIQSSTLNDEINNDFRPYINTTLVKNTILSNFVSVSTIKTTGCRYFSGLRKLQK